MIQLNSITKKFRGPKGEVIALNDINMSLLPGELLVIRGPSGCGKSTLLYTAAGMLKPDKGEVLYRGEDNPYNYSPDRRSILRAGFIGFVFQQFHLIPYLTVLENIMTPSLALNRNNDRERAKELLIQFGLESRADHLPGQLSTGEKQRTALGRALFNKPMVIMADEPTGNLDDENADIVLNHLKKYVKEGGAVLLVTHSKRAVEYATRTINLMNGLILD